MGAATEVGYYIPQEYAIRWAWYGNAVAMAERSSKS